MGGIIYSYNSITFINFESIGIDITNDMVRIANEEYKKNFKKDKGVKKNANTK